MNDSPRGLTSRAGVSGLAPSLLVFSAGTRRPISSAPSISSSSQSSIYRDQRSLPPINTYGEPSRDYGGRYARAPVCAGSSALINDSFSFDSMRGYGNIQQKKRRSNLPKHVTDILRNWFQDHIAHPYPTEDEKLALMQITELTISQVSCSSNPSLNSSTFTHPPLPTIFVTFVSFLFFSLPFLSSSPCNILVVTG